MSPKLESNEEERKICPILSITGEMYSYCVGERCAFYVKGLNVCGIALLCTTLPVLVAKKFNKEAGGLPQENDDLGV